MGLNCDILAGSDPLLRLDQPVCQTSRLCAAEVLEVASSFPFRW